MQTGARQGGFGWGKGRRVIKTIIRDDALTRALERQRRWFEQHGVEDGAPACLTPLEYYFEPERSTRRPADKLPMAKATLRPKADR